MYPSLSIYTSLFLSLPNMKFTHYLSHVILSYLVLFILPHLAQLIQFLILCTSTYPFIQLSIYLPRHRVPSHTASGWGSSLSSPVRSMFPYHLVFRTLAVLVCLSNRFSLRASSIFHYFSLAHISLPCQSPLCMARGGGRTWNMWSPSIKKSFQTTIHITEGARLAYHAECTT